MRQRTFSPVDGTPIDRALATPADLDSRLDRARDAQRIWRATSVQARADRLRAATSALVARSDTLAAEITFEMGRPIRYTPGEVRGFADRATTMIDLAADALSDIRTAEQPGLHRFIRREPLGTVLSLCAWNYPYLIAVNSVVPALMAGNAVLMKHSDQTPSCPERIDAAMTEAGLPDGLFQYLHMSHALTAEAVRDDRVDFVAFTGSVGGGRAVHAAAGGHFKAVGLELGGNDPAYVRHDADLAFAVENLVDGAMFNSGQSCCGIERIYVHRDLYRRFVDGFVALTEQYVLGDPRDPSTTLGPVVRTEAADRIRGVIAAAVHGGARALIDPARFPLAAPGTPFVAPQVVIDAAEDSALVREETFGPVVAIQAVDSDEEAIAKMNASPYGLTASVWTADPDSAMSIGDRVETGTFFANRCDYLDPELAWVGIKNSGRGCTLSRVGYEHLTRPKSFHLRSMA